jgi:hypothetical protein
MLETAASVGWKVKDAIVGFHGIGRLVDARLGSESQQKAEHVLILPVADVACSLK